VPDEQVAQEHAVKDPAEERDSGRPSRYVPDWEPLAVAVERILASSVEEEQARLDLCRAIADGKISIRATVIKPNKPERVFSRDNIVVSKHLKPTDIDWVKSSPTKAWWIGPAPGQHYSGWDGGTMWIDFIEVATADVIELLGPQPVPRTTDAGSRRGLKPRIPFAKIKAVVFDLLDDRGALLHDDPEWHTQGQLEIATRESLKKVFGPKSVPGESTLRSYVSRCLKLWIVEGR
jgi:hypothetical protein